MSLKLVPWKLYLTIYMHVSLKKNNVHCTIKSCRFCDTTVVRNEVIALLFNRGFEIMEKVAKISEMNLQ